MSHSVLVIDYWKREYRHSTIMQFHGHCTLLPQWVEPLCADLNYADEVGFTYLGHNGSKSGIIVSLSLAVFSHQSPMSILWMMAGMYLTIIPWCFVWTHLALWLIIDFLLSLNPPRGPGIKPIVITLICIRVSSIVGHSLVSLNCALDDDIVYCCNPACTAHNNSSKCWLP